MDGIVNKVQSLCTPALVFFIVSVISLFIMIFDNLENTHSYCIGNVSCNVPNTSMIFITEIVFLVLWTWLLNFICSRGYPNVAWFILLFPYILLFMVVLMVASDIRNTEKINRDSKLVPVIAPNNDAFSGLTMRF
jgi:hypothetical protein